jgi:pimeloyl-ACP methyl ester carboxylesterase
MSKAGIVREFVTLAGVKIEVERRGKGKPLLLLMGEEMLEAEGGLVEELERSHEIIIPYPPGFGDSERPLWITRPDDIAFLWLELVEKLKLKDATVLGFSLGGWIAAEMATMDDSWIGRLVLVAPYGIKLGGPTDRDIADVWLLNPKKVMALKWHDQDKGKRDYAAMPDEKLTRIAQAIETTARLCWEPYMYNPKLRHRLHRIGVPTLLVWGENDGIVKAQSYGSGFAELIPGAKLKVIAEAGHLPHLEQPAAFMNALGGFLG